VSLGYRHVGAADILSEDAAGVATSPHGGSIPDTWGRSPITQSYDAFRFPFPQAIGVRVRISIFMETTNEGWVGGCQRGEKSYLRLES
jgi:hypothetical protein